MKQATNKQIRIGCCGFGLAQPAYFEKFSCVEIQQTFYQPPLLKTLSKWRQNAPTEFEFALKAWQLITHTSSSPTFRRLTKKLTSSDLADSGAFRSTAIVKEALEVTLACAEILRAKALLFQSPASFGQTERHMENMRQFFGSFTPPTDVRFYWEPRGNWDEQTIASLCQELNLFRAVDPFAIEQKSAEHVYFRLHGKGGWRYKFTAADQQWLADLLAAKHRKGVAYVFFNNVSMVHDASEFKQVLHANL